MVDLVGRLTVTGAQLVYLGFTIYLVWETWQSADGQVPEINAVAVAATAALATAFGIGYATLLGVPATPGPSAVGAGGIVRFFRWLRRELTLSRLLGASVVVYMAAGVAYGATYVFNEVESPGIVKTIAVAFGGYVIAFLGKAFRDWSV